jgi:YidC/Oxa1 family membrane protein insertase
MDQNRRLLLFFLVSSVVWIGWFAVIQPRFFPAPPQNAALDEKPIDAVDAAALKGESGRGNDAAGDVADAGDAKPVEGADGTGDEAAEAAGDAKPPAVRPDNKPELVVLGSPDPQSGYFQSVRLNSEGAVLDWIALNDDRYRDLENRKNPLHVVGDSGDPSAQTFATRVAAIDAQLAEFKTDTTRVHWKVAKVETDDNGHNTSVEFTLKAPDGTVELFKRYGVRQVKNGGSTVVRDTQYEGYLVDLTVGFRNLTDAPQTLAYSLQGPVGLPLENREHTSKFRDLELGFLDADGGLNTASLPVGDVTEMAASAEKAREATARAATAERRRVARQSVVDDLKRQLSKSPGDAKLKARLETETQTLAELTQLASDRTDDAQTTNRGLEKWKTPFRYLGVDVQYFAVLLMPQDERPVAEKFEDPWIANGEPVVVEEGAKPEFNDVSFVYDGNPMVAAPGQSVSQSWELYAGPKRRELLAPLGAESVLDLGWFAIVSRAMLWILESLHAAGIPYGIAIICLTVLVRGALFPLSRKQAIGAAKMKDLQPKLAELKAKYGSDQEKFLKAQMELFRKHGYGPLGPMASGCLPIFLQLPVFIGLYNALQNSVDLRMAGFLYIDNLAAPDHLWHMPFTIPFLGSWLNLLPFITVILFYIQQKLFMPPATTPEQEMQYKMMNFMMLFMGVFFYHVPAGLCVYFIASSLWSIGERTLLGKTKAAHIGAAEAAEIEHEIEELEHEGTPSAKQGRDKSVRGRSGRDTAVDAKGSTTKSPGLLERLFQAAEQARKQAELGSDKTRPNAPKAKSKTKPRR